MSYMYKVSTELTFCRCLWVLAIKLSSISFTLPCCLNTGSSYFSVKLHFKNSALIIPKTSKQYPKYWNVEANTAQYLGENLKWPRHRLIRITVIIILFIALCWTNFEDSVTFLFFGFLLLISRHTHLYQHICNKFI